MSASTSYGGFVGFDSCEDVVIRNFSATHYLTPLSFNDCSNITFTDAQLDYTLGFLRSKHICLKHITMSIQVWGLDGGHGLYMEDCVNTSMTFMHSMSIDLERSTNTIISHSSFNSSDVAMLLSYCKNTALWNVSISPYQSLEVVGITGMLTRGSAGINIRNLSVTLFRRTGITFQQCSDVTLILRIVHSQTFIPPVIPHQQQTILCSLQSSYLWIRV